jgi:CelD/BcsL family acetyltransferase involved in cellulose biosynthesis
MPQNLSGKTRRTHLFLAAVENSFDFRSAEYHHLFASSDATAFQHPTWLACLYERLVRHKRAEPLIITVRTTAGDLMMVLPLVGRRFGILRSIEFADLRVSDYSAAVADRSTLDAMLGDGALGREIRALIGRYDIMRVSKLSREALSLGRLLGITDRVPMRTNAYAVPLEGSFETWRATHLLPSYAKEIAKKRRQLARQGEFEFALASGASEIEHAFESLRIFRHDRFEVTAGGELMQIPDYFEFYREVAQDTVFARIYTIKLDGKIIAAGLGLALRGTLLVVLSGFTQTEYKNKSVGSLLFEDIARHSIACGDVLLDFTIGDEPYKMTFGATPQPMWQISRSGTVLGHVVNAAVENFPAARTLARNLVHRAGGSKKGPGTDPDEAPPASATTNEIVLPG